MELPFKHLCELYLGPLTSPGTRNSPLGHALANVAANMEFMIDFEKIPGNEFVVDEALLENADQKYLYHLIIGAIRGRDYLRAKYGELLPQPAKMHSARWLTTAIAILVLLFQNIEPTFAEDLRRLGTIVVVWYGPMFFKIKKEPKVFNGAKHFYESIKLARESFNEKELKVATRYIRINSFMAHPEAILLAMVFDEDKDIRMKGLDMIIKARARWEESSKIRKFVAPGPRLNMKANTYYEMVDLNARRYKNYVTAPPLLSKYDDETLTALVKSGTLEVPDIPVHSVNNERCIKDTSQASKMEVGADNVHARILNLQDNRKSISTRPKKSVFLSKKDE